MASGFCVREIHGILLKCSTVSSYGPVSMSVSVCVLRYKSVFYQNEWTDRAGYWHGGFLWPILRLVQQQQFNQHYFAERMQYVKSCGIISSIQKRKSASMQLGDILLKYAAKLATSSAF